MFFYFFLCGREADLWRPKVKRSSHIKPAPIQRVGGPGCPRSRVAKSVWLPRRPNWLDLAAQGLVDNLVNLVDPIFFEKDLLNSTLKGYFTLIGKRWLKLNPLWVFFIYLYSQISYHNVYNIRDYLLRVSLNFS